MAFLYFFIEGFSLPILFAFCLCKSLSFGLKNDPFVVYAISNIFFLLDLGLS
jgi:hypothetical protein